MSAAAQAQVLVGRAAAAGPSTSAAALRAGVQPGSVIGLMRDLRGIASATNSKRTYSAHPAPAAACSNPHPLSLDDSAGSLLSPYRLEKKHISAADECRMLL